MVGMGEPRLVPLDAAALEVLEPSDSSRDTRSVFHALPPSRFTSPPARSECGPCRSEGGSFDSARARPMQRAEPEPSSRMPVEPARGRRGVELQKVHDFLRLPAWQSSSSTIIDGFFLCENDCTESSTSSPDRPLMPPPMAARSSSRSEVICEVIWSRKVACAVASLVSSPCSTLRLATCVSVYLSSMIFCDLNLRCAARNRTRLPTSSTRDW
mmetsp:Transcript_71737/g.190800  ORF Transcript_71737/g.190800 Transcript_71737/m.190800 type:complete len:213 (-) Transcript_71737:22-660(-)